MTGPSDQCPLRGKGGAEGTKGGAFPRPKAGCKVFSSEARFYGFLNDNVIPQSFRKAYNRPDGRGKTSQPRCAREIHPLFGSPPEGEMARWAKQCHAMALNTNDRSIGPVPPPGERRCRRHQRGCISTAVRPVCMFFSSEARFYGFLNDNVIPQSFRKPYNRPNGRGNTPPLPSASPPKGAMVRWTYQTFS